jgi:uncharacterized oxidoreductase
VLGFVPMAVAAVYSATKAALHSYVLSQRFLLKVAGIRVLEIAPPWVRTDLMNSRDAEQAMPLDQFIAETMSVLATDADEILVENAKAFRGNPGPNGAGQRLQSAGARPFQRSRLIRIEQEGRMSCPTSCSRPCG